jgi:phosphoglycerol transferase MdoB-like AlkP superfamily enzyme
MSRNQAPQDTEKAPPLEAQPELSPDAGASEDPSNIRMPLQGPVLRRSLWRQWRSSTLIFCFISVYLELCLHLCVFGSIDLRIVYPILFGLMGGTLCGLICTPLPRIPGRILTVLLTAIQVLYAEVQLVYHAIFGNFMPISLAGMGEGVLTNFGNQILYGIGQNILSILLLLVPLILLIVLLALGQAPKQRVSWRQSLSSLGILALLVAITGGCMLTGRGETFSVYEIFTNVNTSTDISYKNVGMLATTEQELRYMLLGVSQEDTELSQGRLGRTSSTNHYSQLEYNVMDIDFQSLANSTDDEMLQDLDKFFATMMPTRKNDYTGMLEGYNLITICAESFSPYLISEELTPALYKLSTNGIIFENYYGTFQSVTTNGEYTMCMGNYPDMSRTKTQSSFDLSSGNYLPFCLGNALKAEGYQTWAYHNYIGDFYNRNITHANMGYTFQAADSGLDVTIDWPSSDLEMIESSIDDYLSSGSPFHAYYMTFSGHYQYNWDNAMSAKNQAAVEDLPYSDTVKAYIACNLELEYALEYLLERLEEAGVADKTCIVLTNDHYPYGLTEEEYNELAGEEVDATFEKYRNSFICYVPGLRENIYVDEYCSTADILPTLLNLFGVEYDSRLLEGTDILSTGIHMAILSDQSFLTKDFRYDSSTETVTPTVEGTEISEETLGDYRLYVSNKFALSTGILNNNYYAHVFQQDSESSTVLEDTVVFTDISNIFYQASVLYMYRNGYVAPESSDTFGGKSVAEVGEFVDVLYRIAGCPETNEFDLPEKYIDDTFNVSHEYYPAVCWAWSEGILQEGDADDEWDDDVDYRTAALLICRFAQYMGVDTSVDAATLAAAVEEHPRLNEEVIHAFLWVDQENITTKDSELSELYSSYYSRINRYQMTSFLFYLCTYELKLEG